jgi:glycosyltransferase involved in cell wall biosynthesis
MLAKKVAIIVTIYNSENTLEKTLGSIAHQSYTSWEAICVFNNCTDSSKDVFKEFLDNNQEVADKFTALDCSTQGNVAATNTGFIYAASREEIDYIAKLDSDDCWYPDKLLHQIRFLELHPDIDIVGCQMRLINNEHGIIGCTNYPLDDETIKINFYNANNSIANSTSLFKKEVLLRTGLYDDIFPYSEDFWFWLKASRWYKFEDHQEEYQNYLRYQL